MSNQTAKENLSRLKYIPAETLASMNENLPGGLNNRQGGPALREQKLQNIYAYQ